MSLPFCYNTYMNCMKRIRMEQQEVRTYRKWTNSDLRKAVAESYSIRETLAKIGLATAGGNYALIKQYIKKLQLDTSHFKGQGWSRGRKSPEITERQQRPLSYYLQKDKYCNNTDRLRKRLIREKYFEYKCYKCNNTEWLGQRIPLELEHIDGDRYNNLIENLTLLCPNCHALTATYRGKNIGRHEQMPA